MKKLLWVEIQKLRRSKIVWIAVFATVMAAVMIFFGGQDLFDASQSDIYQAGWYMSVAQPLATIFVLPAVIALLGSYMICREEEEDTIKSPRIIPVKEADLTAAKMIVTFIFSVFLYILLFVMTFGVELILHASDLSLHVVLHFFTAYVIDGTGVFLAISPVIAMMSYRKRDFWIALIVTEIYSFTGLFMSLSGTLKKIYPITAVFGISGYYETARTDRMINIFVLLLCGLFSVLLLIHLNYRKTDSEK